MEYIVIENVETGIPCNTGRATSEKDVCLAACKSTGRNVCQSSGCPDTGPAGIAVVSRGAKIR